MHSTLQSCRACISGLIGAGRVSPCAGRLLSAELRLLMGLRDRDYMQDEGGEEKGSRYDHEAHEAKYGDFLTKRQGQNRKLIIVFLVVIVVIVAVAILSSMK